MAKYTVFPHAEEQKNAKTIIKYKEDIGTSPRHTVNKNNKLQKAQDTLLNKNNKLQRNKNMIALKSLSLCVL